MKERIEVNKNVRFTYHDGKHYSGIVKFVEETSEGTLITVLTPERGYRTTKIEMCELLPALKKQQ